MILESSCFYVTVLKRLKKFRGFGFRTPNRCQFFDGKGPVTNVKQTNVFLTLFFGR
jgi:hypothetical protein